MAKDRTIIREGVGTRVEVLLPGATDYRLLPGAASLSDSGGDAPSTTSKNFLQSQTSVGAPTPPPETITVDPWIGTHPVSNGLIKALRNKTSVGYRSTSAQEEILAEAAGVRQLTIAVGGVVSFAGTEAEATQKARWTEDDFSIGLALLADGNLYPVDSITDDGTVSVVKADLSPIAAGDAVAAAEDYAIVQPGERTEGRCRVMSINRSAETDGHYTATIVLQPRQFLSEPTPIYTT